MARRSFVPVHDRGQVRTDVAVMLGDIREAIAHGLVLVVVDQPPTIGALPVTVARAAGVDVAYLPGLAMHRIADLHPGNAKTDVRDAYLIAEAARACRTRSPASRTASTACLPRFTPALERAIGGRLPAGWATEPGQQLQDDLVVQAAGRRRLTAVAKPRAPRIHARIVDAIMAALEQQAVVVPGTVAAELVLSNLADQLAGLLAQRAEVGHRVEEMLEAHPLSKVLTSMSGIGVRTGARTLLEVGDGSAFPTPGHLAAYAGLTPVTRRSGTSIRGEHSNRGGNKKLKNAMFRAAFASLHDPASCAYYDPKTRPAQET